MLRNIVRFLVVSLAVLSIGLSVNAFEMPLGDTGIPDSYRETIKDFSIAIHDFDQFVDALPSAFNWGNQGVVTPAKNQGSCGSCWAFAVVGSFESKILISGGPEYDISEQQQVSCNTLMGGCAGGNMEALMFWYDVGPMLETCTGYSALDSPCSDYSDCNKLDYNTTGYYTVNMDNVEEIKASLYNDGPTYFRFDVYTDFFYFWRTDSPGTVYTQSTGSFEGGHAVQIIGWDDSKEAWLCKNSWGSNSGPNGDGTFWIAYSGHLDNLYFGMANVSIKSISNNYDDQYLEGDWDGDGRANIAVRRGNRILMNFNYDQNHDFDQYYGTGNSESEYLVGDWNGDGRDNIAIRRGNQILMDFDYDGNHDLVQYYGAGNSEDEYLVGDWDGDGRDNIAVRRGNQILMNFDYDRIHDLVQYYGAGNSEDEYLVGDWNGDGRDNIAVRRGNQILMNFDYDRIHDLVQYYGAGNSEDEYLVGDWDGDGRDNIAVRRGNQILMNFDYDGNYDLEQYYGNGTAPK